jgi:hypothetical protein
MDFIDRHFLLRAFYSESAFYKQKSRDFLWTLHIISTSLSSTSKVTSPPIFVFVRNRSSITSISKMAVFDNDEDIVLFTDDWTLVSDEITTPHNDASGASAQEFSDTNSSGSFTWEELASQEGGLSDPKDTTSDHEDFGSNSLGRKDLTPYSKAIPSVTSIAVTEHHESQSTIHLHSRKALIRTTPAPASVQNLLYQSRYAPRIEDAPTVPAPGLKLLMQSRYASTNPDPVLPTLASRTTHTEPVSSHISPQNKIAARDSSKDTTKLSPKASTVSAYFTFESSILAIEYSTTRPRTELLLTKQ